MRIGSRLNCEKGNATLGCFVHKNRRLYAVVSKHAFADRGAVFEGPKNIGFVEGATSDDLDASLVKLSDTVTRELERDDFMVRRDEKSIELTQVFNPPPYRDTKGELPRDIKAMHLIVWHSGSTSEGYAGQAVDRFAYNKQFGTISVAEMMKGIHSFRERHNRPGDSGGPIYMDSGVLVGFNGGGVGAPLPESEGGKGATAGGFYRLAYDVFAVFGVSLATWANRGSWLPVAPTTVVWNVNPLARK